MTDAWRDRREATVEEYITNRTTRAENGCLLWRGGSTKRPGWFSYKGYSVSTNAPLAVYTILVGPVPEGLLLRHTCDNPRCVELTHLVPGTSKQNRQDFMERHPRAREICLTAAKTGAAGLKNFWSQLSPKERQEFITKRAQAQKEKKRAIHCS